jgi:hypothetical protein
MVVRFKLLADKSGERITKFDPVTGEKRLVNPATPGDEHEPWPAAGLQFMDGAPEEMILPTKYVDKLVSAGWAKRHNERPVVRPAGPNQGTFNSSYNGQPHVFIHCDKISIYCVDADYQYEVTRQPDKYVDNDNPADKVTPELYEAGKTKVDHFYGLKLIETHKKGAGRG